MLKVTVGKVGELLTKRPEGMSYEEYREKRKEQDRFLKGFNLKEFNVNGKHVLGRLEGILIPSVKWESNRATQIVIE